MIIVPAWIEKQNEDGFLAVLGSEPPIDSIADLVPMSCVEGCVYSEKEKNGKKFAILTLSKDNIPEKIKKILGL